MRSRTALGQEVHQQRSIRIQLHLLMMVTVILDSNSHRNHSSQIEETFAEK
jgi:hypothetical protein